VATNFPDLADIIGIYNVTLFSAALMTIMSFVWLACDTMVSCIILVIIMGIAGGAFVSLQAPLATKTATDMRFGGTMVGQALCTSLRMTARLSIGLWSHFWCPHRYGNCGGSFRPIPTRHHPWWIDDDYRYDSSGSSTL
jgi:MFS family permease